MPSYWHDATRQPPAQCDDAIKQIDARLNEINPRIDDIAPGGPTHKLTAETGAPEKVLALDEKLRHLRAEGCALETQRTALAAAKEKAQTHEAPGLARAAIKRLKVTLKAAEATAAAHAKNVAELEKLRMDLMIARRIADQANVTCPGLPAADFDRLAILTALNPDQSVQATAPARRRALIELCGRDAAEKTTNPWKNAAITPNRPRAARIVPG